ncbi:MAG: hypothetical protein LUC90_10375 [Lachnospiraceae bacterium]|nr:hypothetical protein [Lachnospiraceae bacterium]
MIDSIRDKMCFSNLKTMEEILSTYCFTAQKFVEDDGSITLSLNEIDLMENGTDERETRRKLGESILEYSTEYYNEYKLYSHASNRRRHIPYIFKALIMDDSEQIGDSIQFQSGKE